MDIIPDNFIRAFAAAALIGYFLGSLNFALITVRLLKGEDVRKSGSGNAGLTNTLRCYGKGCALLTLIGDLSKGVVAVLLSRLICRWLEAGLPPENDTHYIGYIAGLFAIIGHILPIYYGFKGGKRSPCGSFNIYCCKSLMLRSSYWYFCLGTCHFKVCFT